MRRVYLDNNATTRPDPSVVAGMLPFLTEQFGNASSTHGFGEEVAEAVRGARRQVRELLGAAHDHEIVFTSGGTESDNTALNLALMGRPGRDEIVTSAVEHPAVLACLERLAAAGAVRVHTIGVDARGRLDREAFSAALGPRTALVSIMWANNETGTTFPIAQLAAETHRAGALFHTDAVQAVGKLEVNVQQTDVDLLSLSGHKLHGPKGIGALYVRKGTPFTPMMYGGHQERRRRGGTENTPGIIGLGLAAARASAAGAGEIAAIARRRDRLEQGILARIGGCRVNGDGENRVCNTTNIAFEEVEGEAVLAHLDRLGIAASTGSACAAGSTEPSHVLKAMAVPPRALRGAVRFSLSHETTDDDIDVVLSALPAIVDRLRGMNTLSAQLAEPTSA